MVAIAPHSTGATWVDRSGEFTRDHISRVPYLPGLDGMRALAVVAVMIYHANDSWLAGGFLGVEMFFVISGYLITLLLIAEREQTYRISLRQFWLRRARRLLPALFLMMGLLAIWTAFFERDALGQLRGDVISGFFYVSNWYQVWVGLGYTAAGDFAPLRHLWSLAVEEQFYLVWPIVMAALLRRTGTRRVANVSRWLFLAAIAVTVVVGVLYHPGPVGEPAQNPEAYWWLGDRPISKLDTLYLSTFARAGGLLLGAAFAMVWRPYAVARGPLRDKGRTLDVVALVALVGFAWMSWTIHLVDPSGADGRLFRGGLFVSGVLTLAIIAAVTHRGAHTNAVLGNPVLVWIGRRSYGMYLYHWPIYQVIRDVAGNKLTVVEFAVAMAITLVITDVSYRFVETPIRSGRWRPWLARLRRSANPRPRSLLAGGAAFTAVISLFAGASLATAQLQPNEIERSLGEGEGATTDLAAIAVLSDTAADLSTAGATPSTEPGPALIETSPADAPDEPAAPTTAAVAPPPADTPSPDPTPPTSAAAVGATPPPAVPVVPATTAPPAPPPSAPPAEPPAPMQLGLVTDVTEITPLAPSQPPWGIPLVALGDSVMLGAAEELTAQGFVVDAVKSRQLITYLPDLEVISAAGTLTSVVVVHLGTNGPVSNQSLGSMMAILADVPIVVVLTGKGDRNWIGGNNAKIRELPAAHPNVTVLDWEVLAASCPGRCFYDDGIHLTQAGQDYYTGLIRIVLGLP